MPGKEQAKGGLSLSPLGRVRSPLAARGAQAAALPHTCNALSHVGHGGRPKMEGEGGVNNDTPHWDSCRGQDRTWHSELHGSGTVCPQIHV